MRVAMVCPYDLSVPGGVQAQVSGLAEALQRAGISVTVISPSPQGLAESGAGYEFVGVGHSVSIAANGSRAPVAPGPLAMARTLQALRRLAPDVVHVHEPLAPGSSLATLIAGPRPIVGTFHRAGSDALYRAEGVVLRPAARRLDAVVAVSEAAGATAGEVLRIPPGSIEIIPNGVDLRQFVTLRPSGPGAGRTVLFVGRHEERKGLVVLLEAFEILRKNGHEHIAEGLPRLLVVGEGPETTALRQRFGNNEIEWLGPVGDAEKARLLGSTDVFVAPSIRGESFGVILLEAMAAGAPVIASDLPGYRLAAGGAARFVPAGDAPALAEVLAAVLADAGERERLAGLAAEWATGFSLDSIAERYLRVYASLGVRRP
jgi:phosphatidylinositol alpha-mannosyltransferase